MQAPVININGTSADELLANVLNARTAVLDAFRAVQTTTPHGRDFQTAKDGDALYRQARAEHNHQLKRLDDIAKELEDLGYQIAGQRDEIMATKAKATGNHVLEAAPLVVVIGGGDGG